MVVRKEQFVLLDKKAICEGKAVIGIFKGTIWQYSELSPGLFLGITLVMPGGGMISDARHQTRIRIHARQVPYQYPVSSALQLYFESGFLDLFSHPVLTW